MTDSDILDDLDGILSDIDHMIEKVPNDEVSLLLLGIQRTGMRIARGLQKRVENTQHD